jgi:enoyl-CoA hydratase/carnithine racemase
VSDSVSTIWLDNPPVNALTAEMLSTIRDEVGRLGAETRVVVLRGRGERGFSAGADVSGFAAGDDSGAAAIRSTASLIEQTAVPVVAAIHGFCLGGGLELALACDVRLAQADARLGFPEVRLGLLPGGGGTQRAPRLVGHGRSSWLLMSGEPVLASQAEAWGLVDLVVGDLEAGLEDVADTLGAQSPNALREIKQLLRETRDRRDDGAEAAAFARCLASADGQEGIAAFLEKRAPRWSVA